MAPNSAQSNSAQSNSAQSGSVQPDETDDTDPFKFCKRCNMMKPRDEFWTEPKKGPGFYRKQCADCRADGRERSQESRKKSKEKASAPAADATPTDSSPVAPSVSNTFPSSFATFSFDGSFSAPNAQVNISHGQFAAVKFLLNGHGIAPAYITQVDIIRAERLLARFPPVRFPVVRHGVTIGYIEYAPIGWYPAQ